MAAAQSATSISTLDVSQFKDRIFFTLTPHKFGNSAKITDPIAHREFLRLENIPVGEENDPRWAPKVEANMPQVETNTGNGKKGKKKTSTTTATKPLLKSEALDALYEHMSAVKEQLCGKIGGLCNPSYIARSIWSMAKSDVARAESILRDAQKKIRQDLGPAFIADFEPAKERARTLHPNAGGLGPIFNPADYCSADEAAGCFWFEWRYLTLGVPDDLPAELRAEKEAEFQAKLQNAYEETVLALREGFQELISHATEKLTSAPGEKPKIFRDSLIANIDAFIDSFKSRNMGDAALEDLVEKARAITRPDGKALDPDRLRKFANVREETRAKFETIKSELDKLVTEKKGRVMDFSED